MFFIVIFFSHKLAKLHNLKAIDRRSDGAYDLNFQLNSIVNGYVQPTQVCHIIIVIELLKNLNAIIHPYLFIYIHVVVQRLQSLVAFFSQGSHFVCLYNAFKIRILAYKLVTTFCWKCE